MGDRSELDSTLFFAIGVLNDGMSDGGGTLFVVGFATSGAGLGVRDGFVADERLNPMNSISESEPASDEVLSAW